MFNLKALGITIGIMAVIVGTLLFAPLWVSDVICVALYVFAVYCMVNFFLVIHKEKKNA